jgi:hypothetical protein
MSILTVYCLAVISILPQIRALPSFNYIWPLLIMVWIFFSFLANPLYFIRPSLHRLYTYIFFGYVIVIAYISGNGFIGNRFFEFMQVFIFYWAYEINKKRGRQEDGIKLILYLVPVVTIICATSISRYQTSPYASRLAKKDTTSGLELMSQGIGGYEFIYFLLFVAMIMLYVIAYKGSNIKVIPRVGFMTLLLIILATLVFSNFTTVLLMLSLSLIVRIFFPHVKRYTLLLFLSAISVTTIFLQYIAESVVHLFSLESGLSMNSQRLMELYESLSYSTIGASIGARYSAFSESIVTFFDNPILGAILINIRGVDVIGWHSFALDTFALYGIFVGALFLYVWIQPLISIVRQKSVNHSTLPVLMLVSSIILFFLNNMTPSIGFVLYFIFPTIFDWWQLNLKK